MSTSFSENLDQHRDAVDPVTVSNPCPGGGAAQFVQPLAWRRVLPALGVLILSLGMLFFTDHTYHFIYNFSRYFPDQYITAAKQLVSPFTIAAIICTIWILDPRRRTALVALLLALLLAGAAGGILKLVAGRARPEYSLRLDGSSRKELLKLKKAYPKAPIRTDGQHDFWTFGATRRSIVKVPDAFASFPSGHSCAAFALAAFLIFIYPRGRWIWFLAAMGCALARVAQRRHFPEDALFGSALGWLLAQWVFSWAWPPALGEWFLRMIHKRRQGGAEFTPPVRDSEAGQVTI